MRELEESTERLRVSTADLQAFAQSTKADFKELGEQQRRQARMERYYRKVFYGGEHASRGPQRGRRLHSITTLPRFGSKLALYISRE